MHIHLPNSAFLGNINPFLKGYNPSHTGYLKITANKRWIAIHPVVLSMVAAIGLTVDSSRISCERLEAASKHYLERMGLFRLLHVDSGIKITHHEPTGRFIPLTIVRDSGALTRFITDMIPLLHLKPEQARPIEYIVSELIRNVLEHAHSDHGAIVCAQYYKKSRRISIGIADTGIGIKESINQSHNAATHLEAIRLALTPGITGTTRREGGTEFNAGAGLFFIKSIAKVNRDFFIIFSGDSLYKLLKTSGHTKKVRLFADPFEDRHSKEDDLPFWKGTVVGIDIALETTEEFSLLLDLIHEVYIMSVRERKKARYRRPRFA